MPYFLLSLHVLKPIRKYLYRKKKQERKQRLSSFNSTYAPEYLIEQIATLQPDIATFCELYKGPQDDPVMPKLMQGLKDKGLIYYDARIDGRAVISKYPIKETERINKWMFKAILDVNGKRVAVYPAHSN